MVYALLAAPLLLAVTYICSLLYQRYTYIRGRNARGCSDAPHYRHKDPIFGLDLFLKEMRSHNNSVGMQFQRELFAEYGKTIDTKYFTTRIIRTMDKQNVQAVLATNFNDWGLQPLREGIAKPFFDRGINTVDGKHWEFSRSLVKPAFARAEISGCDYLDWHLERFFALLPKDSSETVDLQPLFLRFFLDTSTEFLFGKSSDTLSPDPSTEDTQFIDSFFRVLIGLGLRVRLAWAKVLHRDPQWFEAIRTVHDWVDKYIDAAFDEQLNHNPSSKEDSQNKAFSGPRSGRQYYLLQEMVKRVDNKADLRSEILAVFMPSQGTESYLLANIFHLLARHPRVWNKLRAEVLQHTTDSASQKLTFESLKSLRYLQHVVNEALRIYPISDFAPRSCLRDTVLPTGGGPNGDAPVFVQKGTTINLHIGIIGMDEDTWGADAMEFRPERWEDKDLRPLWGFVPFGGGTRTCPAQQLVYTEAGYVVVRMAQRFERIESRDSKPWTELWSIGATSKYGCQVALSAA